MREKTARYGRDGQDVFSAGNLGLGCRLSGFGAYSQNDTPVYADGQYRIVCDALIWNRAELSEKLSLDYSVSTQAVILEAYKAWGADCPKRINGDFAFAVWDGQKGELFLARDHLGVRPLYYFYNGAAFAFATDIRAVLCLPFVSKQLDEIKLYAELSGTYHIDPEATHFRQIKRLPQAHTLSVSAEGLKTNKYWTPGAGRKIRFDTEEDYAKTLYAVVEDAVRIRVNGVSGKLGAELSGGLDSSVISILTNRELKKTGGGLETLFSWSPPYELVEKKPDDERRLIEAVCRQEGFSCAYFNPNCVQTSAEPDKAFSWGIDEILFTELDYLSSQGARCILSGWGGDDAISLRAGLYQILLRGHIGYFLKQAVWLSKGSPLRFAKIIVSNTVMQWFRPFARFGHENKGLADIVGRDFRQRMKKHCKRDILYFSVDPIRHIQSGVIQTRTELSAWMDAEYGVTHLYPFLDYRVVDFAFTIPRTMYLKNGINRYVFRKAFAGILPPEHAGYFTKDDPVKSDFLHGRNTRERMKNFAGLIDRPLFSPYINWGSLDRAIENLDGWEESWLQNAKLSNKLLYCLKLQRELDGAADNPASDQV